MAIRRIVIVHRIVACFLVLLCLSAGCSQNLQIGGDSSSNSIQGLKAMGYVVVTPKGPDDGGDFGPNTPGEPPIS